MNIAFIGFVSNLKSCLTQIDLPWLLYIFLSSILLFILLCMLLSRAQWGPALKMCSSPSYLWPTCLRGWWRYSMPCLTCIHACVLFCVSSTGTLFAEPPWHSCILSPPSSHVWEGCTGMSWTCLLLHEIISGNQRITQSLPNRKHRMPWGFLWLLSLWFFKLFSEHFEIKW